MTFFKLVESFKKNKYLIILLLLIYSENLAQRSIPNTSNTGYLTIVSVNSSNSEFMIKIRNLKQKNSLSFPDETKIIFEFDDKKYYGNIKKVTLKNGESVPLNIILEKSLQKYGKEFHLYFNPLPREVNEFKLDYKSSNCSSLGYRCELISFNNIQNNNSDDYLNLYKDNIYEEPIIFKDNITNEVIINKTFPYDIDFTSQSEIIKFIDEKLNKKRLEGLYRSLNLNNREEVIRFNTKNELPYSEYELLILYDEEKYIYIAYIIEANCNDCSNWNLGDEKAIIYDDGENLEIIWKYPKNKYGGGFIDQEFKVLYEENKINFNNLSLIKTH